MSTEMGEANMRTHCGSCSGTHQRLEWSVEVASQLFAAPYVYENHKTLQPGVYIFIMQTDNKIKANKFTVVK